MAETNAARQKCQGQEAMGESKNCFPEPEVKYVIIMCFGKAFYISVSSKVFFEYRCSTHSLEYMDAVCAQLQCFC